VGNTKSLFQKIHRIQVTTNRLVDTLLQGAYRSAFKGNGIEFDEVRPYETGDDVRAIDWNVTARYYSPYVKRFTEERELTVMLLVDLSASLHYGTVNRTKQETIAEVAALLAFSAIRNNDKVGVIFFTNKIEKYIPPKKGSRHVLRVVREILEFNPEGIGTDIGLALTYLQHVQRKTAVAFVLSDFETEMDYETPLKVVSRKHDLIAVAVSDPTEKTLPIMALTVMRDLETGELAVVDGEDTEMLQAYYEESQKKQKKLVAQIGKMKGGYLPLSTNQKYEVGVRNFFKRRRVRQ
jgi:uncharacterized protein (DUF58 family)